MIEARDLMYKPLGQILLQQKKVSSTELNTALSIQREKGGLLGRILMALGTTTEPEVLEALSIQLGVEYIPECDVEEIDPSLVTRISIQYAKQHTMLPVLNKDGVLTVAVNNPLETAFVSDLYILYNQPVKIVLMPKENILAGINKVFDRMMSAEKVIQDVRDDDDIEGDDLLTEEQIDLIEGTDDAPIIRLVNSVIRQAVKEMVSDIHIEPFENDVAVRFRKDGVLREIIRVPRKLQSGVTTRIKIMGNLNIAEKRLPQDGRIRRKVAGNEIDFRLSTVPTGFGERIVLRILDKEATILNLEDLGFRGDHLTNFERLITLPHGIILVTGPTGSGKTTTLYAALSRINTPDKNILTVEDPVEYQLPGIGQMQVNPKIGFTFASGLRSILRQDPDVVLVGEIRDVETSEIAVQASLTGHLVFSTLHTNDAASSFTRLVDMGVEPFLIASSVVAILAQRLVRRICPDCRVDYLPTEFEMEELGLQEMLAKGERPKFYKGTGCSNCYNSGYRGRSAIYELIIVDDKVRSLIVRKEDASIIKKQAIASGMKTLRQDGANKVLQGITTVEEVMRVAQGEVE